MILINNKEVAILLSTYNSEMYLQQLINSIIEQSLNNWTLYIRDDGSVDSTLSIIDWFTQCNDNIIFINDNYENIGSMNSFVKLLEQVVSKYYMFCDHDDVWLRSKIELTYNKMNQVESFYGENTPVLIHTDLKVVDENLDVKSESFWSNSKLNPKILKRFNFIGVCNCATGCTMMFNNKTRNISLPISLEAPMHDWWISSLVSKRGIIEEVNESTILYRQHSCNVVGSRDVDICYFVKKIVNVKHTIKMQLENRKFLVAIEYGSIWKYYYFKLLYTILRNVCVYRR